MTHYIGLGGLEQWVPTIIEHYHDMPLVEAVLACKAHMIRARSTR